MKIWNNIYIKNLTYTRGILLIHIIRDYVEKQL